MKNANMESKLSLNFKPVSLYNYRKTLEKYATDEIIKSSRQNKRVFLKETLISLTDNSDSKKMIKKHNEWA